MDCLEELRRYRLQHTVLKSIGRSSAGTVSKKLANDLAQAWAQKTVRPNPQQEQKQTEMQNANKLGTGGTSVTNTSRDSTERFTRWVELLGRCIGAQLSILVAPVLEPEVEIEPERSAVVLAEMHAQAAEARMMQCRDEATRLGRRAHSALGDTISNVLMTSCTNSNANAAIVGTRSNEDANVTSNSDAFSTGHDTTNHSCSTTVGKLVVQKAMAELQLYCARRRAAESQANACAQQQQQQQQQQREDVNQHCHGAADHAGGPPDGMGQCQETGPARLETGEVQKQLQQECDLLTTIETFLAHALQL